jgi:protocatechuate 3,4-dioxygenase beta subunit
VAGGEPIAGSGVEICAMPDDRQLQRRRILHSTLALGGLAVATPIRAALAQLTPDQSLGPFYPVRKPLDQDADLTVIAGKGGRAKGQILHVMGRVLDSQGRPVRGARIEIWQANARGRYSHPLDSNPEPLDPNFEGFALLTTDNDGHYRFKTIKPGAYPVSKDWTRPPHIHFDVTGHTGRAVTQMYFENEPLNAEDQLLQNAWNQPALIAKYQTPSDDMEPDSLVAVWDIVLPEA